MGSLCTRKLDLYMRECVRDPFVQTNLHLSCPDLSTAHWSSTLVNENKTNTNASINTNTSVSNQQIPFLQKQQRMIFQNNKQKTFKDLFIKSKNTNPMKHPSVYTYTTCSNKEKLCFSITTITRLREKQILILARNTSLSILLILQLPKILYSRYKSWNISAELNGWEGALGLQFTFKSQGGRVEQGRVLQSVPCFDFSQYDC